ncbi:MAG: hypothetical protein FD124_32 [Alphaproteobacteria bacterium]|nr:MAG: hypothetical protein FD124_32 [Alphaproteobacteria bacterium]
MGGRMDELQQLQNLRSTGSGIDLSSLNAAAILVFVMA